MDSANEACLRIAIVYRKSAYIGSENCVGARPTSAGVATFLLRLRTGITHGRVAQKKHVSEHHTYIAGALVDSVLAITNVGEC